MSKKKDKKDKLPKRIAGVKLSKDVRRQAERALAELRQPIVREMIAGVVGMAAATLAKQAGVTPKEPPLPEPQSAPPKAVNGQLAGGHLTEIATGLAVVGLGKLLSKMQTEHSLKVAPKG